MAKAVAISLRAVQRLWNAHHLQPHRLRTFKRSRDPKFAENVVGLYMDPPAHAVVVSIDEKSQILALDRTQPGLPLKPGKCGTMTHDYKRNGTTTLFAALNVLDGTVIGRCTSQHRHQEFIRFLNSVECAVPAGKVIDAIVDNYATHKQSQCLEMARRTSALDVSFHADINAAEAGTPASSAQNGMAAAAYCFFSHCNVNAKLGTLDYVSWSNLKGVTL